MSAEPTRRSTPSSGSTQASVSRIATYWRASARPSVSMIEMVRDTGGTSTFSRNVRPASTSLPCTCSITLLRSSETLPSSMLTAPGALLGSSVRSATSWLWARRLAASHRSANCSDASSFSVTSVA